MRWSDLGEAVGAAAPLLGTLLGGPAGGAVGSMIARALGSDDNPEAVQAAITADPDAAGKLRLLQEENRTRLEEAGIRARTARLTEINETMRREAASDDRYVRRWRPTFGYVVAATWFLQTAAIFGAIAFSVFEPQFGVEILDAVAGLVQALMGQWAIALTVLGVNVASRSKDKEIAAGHAPGPGILGALAARLAGGSK